MWRHEPFVEFVHRLAEQDCCGEIIIINNDSSRTPSIHNSKIRLLDYGKNIGVNPAWNVGVYASNYDNICIMNDDIDFDFAVFEKVSNVLSKGVLLVNSVWPFDDPRPNPGTIDIRSYQEGDQLFHYGSLMFITKSDWIHIPSDLVIFFGDNWIWNHMQARYNTVQIIWNLRLHTPGSVTCNLFANKHEILNHEGQIFHDRMLLMLNSLTARE